MSSLIFSEKKKKKKYSRFLSAAGVIGASRVNKHFILSARFTEPMTVKPTSI